MHHLPYPLQLPMTSGMVSLMFSTIFYEQPLLHTTVIDTRHDGARSQVTDTKPLTSGCNMPVYRCGLKPDEFRHASRKRTSDQGPTCMNLGPGQKLYTRIAFDETVTFWLQCAGSLPCACVFAALYACEIV